jgi:hypothetical protein
MILVSFATKEVVSTNEGTDILFLQQTNWLEDDDVSTACAPAFFKADELELNENIDREGVLSAPLRLFSR